jgi:hypothetical protein
MYTRGSPFMPTFVFSPLEYSAKKNKLDITKSSNAAAR